MTVVNYECLGTTNKIKARRYNILCLRWIKGYNAQDIAAALNVSRRLVYEDIDYIKKHKMNDLPLEIWKDLDQSWFLIKIKELEAKLDQVESTTQWINIQNTILGYKKEFMKLTGVYEEQINHTGEIVIKYEGDEIDSGNSDQIPTTPSTETISFIEKEI